MALLLTCLLGTQAVGFVYRPSTGRFKDGFVLWNEGRFYLYSMYMDAPGDDSHFRNVWLATSPDGVHWQDVGPVISNAPFNIWAMAVHRVGDRFIMNHGSFSQPGLQNVIRFWKSMDLVHWTYMGSETDLFPDTRWYDPNSRLDCMSVVRALEDGHARYFGYATGPGGFLESDDGLHWSGMPGPHFDWGTVPPPPMSPEEGVFEVGGCHEIGGRYYYLGGWFNYMGTTGYGVYTLTADTPRGPFRPDEAAYRLCGNSGRWVALWARFCPTDRELLVNGYMYSGYTYETGETWLPPLKRAVVDSDAHLRLAYWPGNEAIKGTPVDVDLSGCRMVFPGVAGGDCLSGMSAGRLDLQAQPERGSIDRTGVPTTVAVLDSALDFSKGVAIEGTIQATCRDRRLGAPSAGLYLEEQPGEGTAILLHGYGRTEIGKMTLAEGLTFAPEDVIGPGCAAPAGIAPHRDHAFRLLARANMFEFYLDDMLVQTFNTTHEPGGIGRTPVRLGFIAQNGQGLFGDVKAWSMSLGE